MMLGLRMKHGSARMVVGAVTACAVALLGGHPAQVLGESDPVYLAQPVFLTARGTHDEMLTGLVGFHETNIAEWRAANTRIPYIRPGVTIAFQSIDQRLRIISPAMSQYWPFVFSWLKDRRIDLECCQLDQPDLDEVQHTRYYSFKAPYIRYDIFDDTAAYVLLTEVDATESEENLLEWGKVYTIEIAAASFIEDAGWNLTLAAEGVLASWSTPLQQAEQKHGINHIPKAAWLVFTGEGIMERLIPGVAKITSVHSRTATEVRYDRHGYFGAEEYYPQFPASESGAFRIPCIRAGREDRERAVSIQEITEDIAGWSAAHVGVFSMGDKGWLLLIFEGVDE